MSDAPVCTALTGLPPLHNTFGALFIGVTLAGMLWGITSMQTYNYFLQYFRVDRPLLNITVGVVYTLDTLHQIFLSHLLYVYLVSNWGNMVILNTLLWSVIAMVLMSALIGFIVQLFLCYRVWVLSRNNIFVTGAVLLPVFGLFGTTMAYISIAWSQNFTLFSDLGKVEALSKTVNAFGAFSDVSITCALSYFLWTSKSGIRKTDAIMNRLILFCVRSGLLTTINAILSLITISVFPGTFIYICFYSILARFYSFSLLATLNARKDLRNQTGSTHANSFAASVSLEPNPTGTWNRRPQETASGVRHITIKQDVETMISHEYEMKPSQGLP